MTDIKSTLMWKEINETPVAFSKIKANNQKVMDALLSDVKANPICGIYAAGRGTSDHALVYFKYVCEIFAGIPVGGFGMLHSGNTHRHQIPITLLQIPTMGTPRLHIKPGVI